MMRPNAIAIRRDSDALRFGLKVNPERNRIAAASANYGEWAPGEVGSPRNPIKHPTKHPADISMGAKPSVQHSVKDAQAFGWYPI